MSKTEVKNPTPQILPILNELFKFKIGDHVFTRNDLVAHTTQFELHPADSYEKLSVPLPLTVTGRRLDECHGGVQMFYVVSGLSSSATGGPVATTFNEFELIDHQEIVDLIKARARTIADLKTAKAEARSG